MNFATLISEGVAAMRTFQESHVAGVPLRAPVAAAPNPPPRKPGLDRIGHIVVLFLQNSGFDHLLRDIPGGC